MVNIFYKLYDTSINALKVLTLGICIFYGNTAYSQSQTEIPQPTPPKKETPSPAAKKLNPSEINFLFNYYEQDGNNSAVTGGTGRKTRRQGCNDYRQCANRYDLYHECGFWCKYLHFRLFR